MAVWFGPGREETSMAIRYLKIVLVALVGLLGLLYFAGNVSNWSAGLGAVAYVVGMQGHEIYVSHIFPSVSHPALVTIAYLIILAGELLVGVLSLKGAWDLWRARHTSSDAFNAAKTYAILGTGMALLVWFGGFIVIGSALFQMWQTQMGSNSFHDAFIFAAMSGLVLLFLTQPDD
jgi:predicted small integral membrane protein